MLGVGLGLLFGLFGWISFQTINQSTDAALQVRLANARAAAKSTDDLIMHTRHQLESVAALPSLVSGNNQEQTSTLHNLLHVLGSFETIRLLDSRGQIYWAESVSQGKQLLNHGDLSGREDIAQVMATGETVITQVPLTATDHPPIAVISVPVKDAQGNLRNIVQGDLHLAHMGSELIPLPELSSTSRGSIVDRLGNVIVSTDGEEATEGEEHLELLSTFLSEGVPGVTIHASSQGDHVVAFAPLSILGGGVILEEQEDAVLAVSQRLRSTLLVLGLSALLLASLGAWIYIRRVIQPLKALTEATTFIAQGRLDNSVIISRGDEIGKLGQSFESMRRQLVVAQEKQKAWEQELEERVRLRTAQVHHLMGRIISTQEEERKRIARELHDGAAQNVATFTVQLAAIEQSMPATEEMEPLRQLTRRAKTYASRTLSELRLMMQDLRPSALDDMGLVAGVRWYATTHLEAAGIRVQFQVLGDVPTLDGNIETAIFRILQEAINNAASHARASNVSVTLTFEPHLLRTTVRDDGIGFDLEAVRASEGGMGIVSMEERADLIGGRLTLRSLPGAGTEVDLEVPLDG